MSRPNILFALADDASHMGIYGHRFVHTPNFDRVAKAGVLFANAFTTNPKCAPSRACILTGMHTWQLEEACNHQCIFPSKFKVYPDLLEEAGYAVGYTGKGWGPGDWQRGGFARNPAGPEYNEQFLTPPENTGISKKDYAANFAQFLAQRPEGAPFCFWYGGHEPHRKYVEGEGLRAGKSLDDVDVPSYLPEDDIVRSDLLDYAYEIEWFDKQLGLMLDKLEEIGELENTLVIVTSDNGMSFPRVKGQMYEQDFHLPLAVCWLKEVPGGRRVEDLISFIDYAPTFLEVAGIPQHPQMGGRSLVSLLKSGQSGRVEPARSRVYMGKERHDLGRENDVGYPVRCLRTEQYLYVRNFTPDAWPAGNPETGYTNVDDSPTKRFILSQHNAGENYYYQLSFGKRPAEELYDITIDEECMNNLAYNEDYFDLKQKLWEELELKLRLTGDPRMFGQGHVFNEYEHVGKKGTSKDKSWKIYMKQQALMNNTVSE